MPDADLYELAERYRSEFPIFRSAVYLNSCSLGALSDRARRGLQEYADLWSRWGASAWYDYWLEVADAVRASYARIIGVKRSEAALAPSISGALASVCSAIDFSKRTRVVTTDLDFPTLVYHFLAKRADGVETVVLSSPDGISVPLEAFTEAVDERTAVIATSHVYFTTGAIQDIAALSRLAHENGALLLIDAYQSIGQVPVDARAAGIDILLSGGLKWLLGGTGLAYAYVRGELLERLEPTVVSWFGVEDQFDFDPRRLRLRGDARRFELGTPAVPTLYTARAGLELIEEIGVERIRTRVASLTEDLRDRALAHGLRVRGAGERERRSGIVMVEHRDPAAAVKRLRDAGVIVDHRPGAVRMSPHFYNTTEDSAAAIEAMAV
ncbi:MAG: aminotransferase class V-fold PLP-dependent enzyme [Gemmatimonadota bacterium]|nr:MAG: aminotransferase class V-fold PLP-dependent enzyme [Gemmatimonadota bacterium]